MDLKTQHDIIYNSNHERFINSMDTWIYEPTRINFPLYVKKIWYIQIDNKVVQLSRLVNIFLNYVFQNQNSTVLQYVGENNLYNLMIELNKYPLDIDDIKTKFINKESFFELNNSYYIYNFSNVTKYKVEFNLRIYDLLSTNIKEPTLTNWRFKDLYDFIPVCGICPEIDNEDLFNISSNAKFSNICFHLNNCHDKYCLEHNKNQIDTSYFRRKYKHSHNKYFPIYQISDNQRIDIFKL